MAAIWNIHADAHATMADKRTARVCVHVGAVIAENRDMAEDMVARDARVQWLMQRWDATPRVSYGYECVGDAPNVGLFY